MEKVENLVVNAIWCKLPGREFMCYAAQLSDGTQREFTDQVDLLNKLGEEGWRGWGLLKEEKDPHNITFYFSRVKSE